MKRIFLLATMIAFFAIGKVSAQTVNGINLSDLKQEYIEFHAFRQGDKMLIWLEYGQKVLYDRHAAIVKDVKGKNLEFNSAIEFLNTMRSNGYELFQAHSVATGNDVTKYYVLKRKN
ncbi:hypothetical protein [Pedobacter xixiisoli]|uniref:Uncharacterized protein n=1 Tax=Pedobacter xixiisoli TaxID=1476464 RepID=A0A286ACG4_9SPHI|nr:hypothetical protein [Pedobacter xixiisoli]SOD19600.1 hypothetical protein SAMN06297358_3304 [Pedobacter xixiisoli]